MSGLLEIAAGALFLGEMALRYKLLGNSGLRVSELCLGTMTFGEEWGWGAPKDECKRILGAFVDAGGNFIDTANNYTNGTSEKFLGEFIESDRDRYVIATKYSLNTRKGDPNAGGNHRKNMMQSVKASLERLRTDYMDLFWLHMWDFMTPIDEVMRGLDDLVKSGRVHYVGVSDTPAWVVSRANAIAELRGWTSFLALQVPYSVIARTPERDLLPMARALGLAVTAWAPLEHGLLTGKYTRKSERAEGRRKVEGWEISERELSLAGELDKVADEVGRSSAQVALNWVRQQPGIIIPIVGATKATQLQDSLGCLDFRLNESQMKRLDALAKVELGFPHSFLQAHEVRELIFGGTYPNIDNHRGPIYA